MAIWGVPLVLEGPLLSEMDKVCWKRGHRWDSQDRECLRCGERRPVAVSTKPFRTTIPKEES